MQEVLQRKDLSVVLVVAGMTQVTAHFQGPEFPKSEAASVRLSTHYLTHIT
jgi:hypothetical protein